MISTDGCFISSPGDIWEVARTNEEQTLLSCTENTGAAGTHIPAPGQQVQILTGKQHGGLCLCGVLSGVRGMYTFWGDLLLTVTTSLLAP